MYSNNNPFEFIKCTMRALDIETEVKQISFYHTRGSIHSGINETYNNIKTTIYFPKLRELTQLATNQCDLCQQVKYDRHPIKNKFQFTETPSNKNQIIYKLWIHMQKKAIIFKQQSISFEVLIH